MKQLQPVQPPNYWKRVAQDARKASENNLKLAGQRGIEVERLSLQLKAAQGHINRIVDLVNEGRRQATPEAQAAYLEKIAASLGLARYVRIEENSEQVMP